MRHTIIAIVLATLPAGVLAGGFFYSSKLPVNRVSSTQFEVIEAYGKGPNGIWCAAADYAIHTLGITSGRLYIATPRGSSVTEPGRTGVVFSTKPIEGVQGRATNSIRETGANLLVNHAIQFCRDDIIEPGDLL